MLNFRVEKTSLHPPDSDLIYDWNRAGGAVFPKRGRVELDDETLRDGLQSPSVKSPSIEQKIRILHLMEALGIDSADIGLPGAGPHVVETVTRLAQEIVRGKLKIRPNCAARTVAADIVPIIEISQKVGIPIEVSCFIGSSPIRQYAEDWDFDKMLRLSEDAVSLAVREGLPVMYVTEDTTRAHPITCGGCTRPRSVPARAASASATRWGTPRPTACATSWPSFRASSTRSTRRSRSTGTATRTAGSASQRALAPSRPAPTASTPAGSASASASATRRWISCSSTSSSSAGSTGT